MHLPDMISDCYLSEIAKSAIIQPKFKKIMKKYIYFIPESYPAFVQMCQKLLMSPEPGTIIAPPKNGMLQRVDQLIQDYHDRFDQPLIHIDLGPSYEDLHAITEYILSKGYTLGKDQ